MGSLGFCKRIDRISDLPDGIIIKILSYLDVDEAASTSILSKIWRDLFVFRQNLNLSYVCRFDCFDKAGYQKRFIDFVERMLAASGNSSIRSFTLECRDCDVSARTDRWIRNVLKRGSVLELDLYAYARAPLLSEVFACKILVNLKLRGFTIPMLPEDASSNSFIMTTQSKRNQTKILIETLITMFSGETIRITTDLRMLPRASSKCRIQVKFS